MLSVIVMSLEWAVFGRGGEVLGLQFGGVAFVFGCLQLEVGLVFEFVVAGAVFEDECFFEGLCLLGGGLDNADGVAVA